MYLLTDTIGPTVGRIGAEADEFTTPAPSVLDSTLSSRSGDCEEKLGAEWAFTAVDKGVIEVGLAISINLQLLFHIECLPVEEEIYL